MKKTLALAAVVVAVLAPTGAAHAADGAPGGHAYGNCGHNSSGGGGTRLAGGAGDGHCQREDHRQKPKRGTAENAAPKPDRHHGDNMVEACDGMQKPRFQSAEASCLVRESRICKA